MEDMLKDFLLGEHLLLVGNQGVGKNKIVDRFLFLVNRPREYLQLHRFHMICYHRVLCEVQHIPGKNITKQSSLMALNAG